MDSLLKKELPPKEKRMRAMYLLPEVIKAIQGKDAALIVRAVNAYEKDQETIRELLASLREYKEAAVNGSVVTIGMARRSAAAIAKAESHEKPL